MGVRPRFRRKSWISTFLCRGLPLLLALLGASSAQNSSPPSPYVFRIYEDLVQVPTLVLNGLHGSYPALTRNAFSMSLDHGPVFQPRHIRLEEDDPVSLSLVVDIASDSVRKMFQQKSALDDLPPDWLSARDHLSVYAADCELIRTADDQPFSPGLLKLRLAQALTYPTLHGGEAQTSHCASRQRLWDELAAVVAETGKRPGRRVILVLTDGEDRGSRNTWSDLVRYAGSLSVAIMGLRPATEDAPILLPGEADQTPDVRERSMAFVLRRKTEYLFGMVCAGTGGIAFDVQPKSLSLQLQRTVELLRARYILEFARPTNGTIGLHQLAVTLPADSQAIVRPSGIAFPLQDKEQLADPATLASDPARAPQQGTRGILTQQH